MVVVCWETHLQDGHEDGAKVFVSPEDVLTFANRIFGRRPG
jgi:hypothetical protein